MNQIPKIGAYVLETLTTGMYTNPLDTLREFVQNAADSIRKAEIKGRGRIEIRIDPQTRTIIVRDNGVGISQSDVSNRLINIGMSDKRIEVDAGFRGIGRLAGIAYCKRLYFRTSAEGENKVSTIEIDCEGIKKAVSPAMRQVEELPDVIDRNSKARLENCNAKDHFFEVIMEGITETASRFFEIQELENYLCQVAPVEFDAQRFIFAPKINEWVKRYNLSVPTVALIIKAPGLERQVFKPYITHYHTRNTNGGKYDFDIKDIFFYPESPSSEILFWAWYSKTDLLGMIEDERSAGLRIRKNNIAIGGPERVAELFANTAKTNSRFNAYYIGEIHIVSPEAIPNARRDGLEDVGTWPKIKADLIPFVNDLSEEVRKTSEARNRPTQKIVASVNAIIQDTDERLKTGFVSKEEHDTLLAKVIKEEERVVKALESRKNLEDIQVIHPLVNNLKKIRVDLEQKNHFAVKNLRSNLDRKQRKIITEVLKILYETFEEENFKKAKTAILSRFQINESESES